MKTEEQKRKHREEIARKHREWKKANRDEYSEIHRRAQKKYDSKNKDKKRAHWIVKSFKLKGVIKNKPCVICGNTKSEAHHPDYSKPINIMWLCDKRHKQVHEEIKKRPKIKKKTCKKESINVLDVAGYGLNLNRFRIILQTIQFYL